MSGILVKNHGGKPRGFLKLGKIFRTKWRESIWTGEAISHSQIFHWLLGEKMRKIKQTMALFEGSEDQKISAEKYLSASRETLHLGEEPQPDVSL